MTLAHTAGAGGPEIEFLILAAAVMVLGVVFFFQKNVKPAVPIVMVVLAFALVGGGFLFSSGSGSAPSTDATLTITSPEADEVVPADESFALEVDLQGATLAGEDAGNKDAGHLHVFVDGELISMPMVSTPEVELAPGEHDITVEFTTADHRSYEPRVLDEVAVTAE